MSSYCLKCKTEKTESKNSRIAITKKMKANGFIKMGSV